MSVISCIPIIPSTNLEKSLKFWVEGLGLTMDREMKREGKLIGCMVHNEHTCFWLNETDENQTRPKDFEGIRLYWAPLDIHKTRERLLSLGFEVSDIEHRHYGQTEFFVTDVDGHSHCFGISTKQ